MLIFLKIKFRENDKFNTENPFKFPSSCYDHCRKKEKDKRGLPALGYGGNMKILCKEDPLPVDNQILL